MNKLNDGTEIPDILKYMALEYRDKTLYDKWIPKHGNNKSMGELTKNEMILYCREAFEYFINTIS